MENMCNKGADAPDQLASWPDASIVFEISGDNEIRQRRRRRERIRVYFM